MVKCDKSDVVYDWVYSWYRFLGVMCILGIIFIAGFIFFGMPWVLLGIMDRINPISIEDYANASIIITLCHGLILLLVYLLIRGVSNCASICKILRRK